jgi:MFS transporter, DHA3 family, macrolide efflux protein
MEKNIKTKGGILFAYRNFVFLWIGQSVSTFGDKFSEIGIPILVYRLTNSPFQLGLAFLAEVMSSIILGLLGGAISDRLNRRKIMIVADVTRCLLVMSIPFLAYTPMNIGLKLWLIYILIFVLSSIRYFFLPAKISVIPDTVPPEQLMAANSADQATMKIMEFVGYGAAGLLIQTAGVERAFYIDAASFAFSVLMISFIKLPRLEQHAAQAGDSIIAVIHEGISLI